VNISAKIWLSISALVLGYLVTVIIDSLLGLRAEQRLDHTATALFPLTTLSREAEIAMQGQVQAYQDAVLTGDPDQFTVAGNAAHATAQALAGQLALADLDDAQRARIRGLADRHAAYTADAGKAYPALIKGLSGADATVEAARLNAAATALRTDFSALVAEATRELRQELAQTVARSQHQRHLGVAVLLVAAGVSCTLVYLVISRWTHRLGGLVQASERVARGDFSVGVADRGGDEVGRLSQSFAFMQAAVSARNEELRRFTEGLEETVRQRTKEVTARNAELVHEIDERRRAEAAVQSLHNQLLDASRQAGMAEVATGVLHNVGNVLNSVNVAVTVIAEQLRENKAANLARAAAMMLERGAGLGAFLTEDAKGRQLPGYLAKLAEHLAAQHATVGRELGGLAANIEHIREIVQLQQSHGQSIGVVQMLRPQDLGDEALRLNAPALARHEVAAVADYADVPPCALDRHKVLQILVNLITNARQAITEQNPPLRRVVLRIRAAHARAIAFSVSDTGVGIAPDVLARIFTHGFTTKKDGHGFGLHSCANAAREMHGTLTVHSDGVGTGATFTLELPVDGRGVGG
jgi:C4-dicarboxylate-specific signal transduction histidine kinase